MSSNEPMVELCACSAPVSKESKAAKKCQECGRSFYHFKTTFGHPPPEKPKASTFSHAIAAEVQPKVNLDPSQEINIPELVKHQKLAIWGFLSAALCIIPYAFILVIPFQAYCYFKLSRTLEIDLFSSIVVTTLMMVPLLNLILLLVLNNKATSELRSRGIKVGFMGAKAGQSLS